MAAKLANFWPANAQAASANIRLRWNYRPDSDLYVIYTPQDRVGLAQAPPGVTRFRVTFTKPGYYPYICALHDVLGMKGVVRVIP